MDGDGDRRRVAAAVVIVDFDIRGDRQGLPRAEEIKILVRDRIGPIDRSAVVARLGEGERLLEFGDLRCIQGQRIAVGIGSSTMTNRQRPLRLRSFRHGPHRDEATGYRSPAVG